MNLKNYKAKKKEHFIFLIFISFAAPMAYGISHGAAPMAYGGSQARSPTGAAAAGLHHSHSNGRSELCLRATPQLTATPDP